MYVGSTARRILTPFDPARWFRGGFNESPIEGGRESFENPQSGICLTPLDFADVFQAEVRKTRELRLAQATRPPLLLKSEAESFVETHFARAPRLETRRRCTRHLIPLVDRAISCYIQLRHVRR